MASVAHDLDVSDQTIYNWRRQDRIDRGEVEGLTSKEKGEHVKPGAVQRLARALLYWEGGLPIVAAASTGDGTGSRPS